jgi:hypothetical protein
MILSWRAGLTSIDVGLVLQNGVALKDPELWQRQGSDWVQFPRASLTAAHAGWSGISPWQGEQELALQLYWIAFDPMNPVWAYDAVIEVRDQDAQLLDGAFGFGNPTTEPHMLANNWDHGSTSIVVV